MSILKSQTNIQGFFDVQEKGLIDYNNEFIQRITVFSKIGEESEVDKREEARYSSSIKIEKVEERYNETMQLCKESIAQAEEIVFSDKEFKVPKEIYE